MTLKLSQMMNVGIPDFSGPAQFIRANGLFGFPLFFSWPISLCLGFEYWSTSLITTKCLDFISSRSAVCVLCESAEHAGSSWCNTTSGISDFFLPAVCLNMGVAWSPGDLWAGLHVTVGSLSPEAPPTFQCCWPELQETWAHGLLVPRMQLGDCRQTPQTTVSLSRGFSMGMARGQEKAIHKAWLCTLPVCWRAPGALVRMQILCQPSAVRMTS